MNSSRPAHPSVTEYNNVLLRSSTEPMKQNSTDKKVDSTFSVLLGKVTGSLQDALVTPLSDSVIYTKKIVSDLRSPVTQITVNTNSGMIPKQNPPNRTGVDSSSQSSNPVKVKVPKIGVNGARSASKEKPKGEVYNILKDIQTRLCNIENTGYYIEKKVDDVWDRVQPGSICGGHKEEHPTSLMTSAFELQKRPIPGVPSSIRMNGGGSSPSVKNSSGTSYEDAVFEWKDTPPPPENNTFSNIAAATTMSKVLSRHNSHENVNLEGRTPSRPNTPGGLIKEKVVLMESSDYNIN